MRCSAAQRIKDLNACEAEWYVKLDVPVLFDCISALVKYLLYRLWTDVSKRFDLYLLMRCATLTTFVLLFGDNTCDRKTTLNTWPWARAGTFSPYEASAGGNNGKHSDFVIITTCRHRRRRWHPDSNRIKVIKEKDWKAAPSQFRDAALADSTRLFFFIHTFQTVFYSQRFDTHSFFSCHYHVSLPASSSVAPRQTNLAPVPRHKNMWLSASWMFYEPCDNF